MPIGTQLIGKIAKFGKTAEHPMNAKLIKTLLLAATLGFFLLWILEVMRTDLGSSYWLLMLSLTFLLGHQYYRLKTQPVTPTKRTESRPEQRPARPPKGKKKK